MSHVEAIHFQIGFDGNKPLSLEINDIRDLTVNVGVNGSGKSLYLQVVWFVKFIESIYKVQMVIGSTTIEETIKKYIQDLARYTWEYESIDFLVSLIGSDSRFDFHLKQDLDTSEVALLNLDVLDPKKYVASGIIPVNYVSNQVRSFSSFKKYIELRSRLNITAVDLPEIQQMSFMFKAYDIVWFENALNYLKYAFKKMGQSMFDHLIDNLTFLSPYNKIVKLHYDPENPADISATFEDGTSKKLLLMSSGEQSMLVLLLLTPNGIGGAS